ncbi:MAG: nucleotidyltransferase domain-containing protein [Candidatus Brocadiia bacterium]
MSAIENNILSVLTRYPELRLAMLFGSQATGRANGDSDIDLGLLAEAPLSAAFKLDLMQRLGAVCGRPVDIVDLHTAGEPVLGEVLKGGRLLGDASTYAQLLSASREGALLLPGRAEGRHCNKELRHRCPVTLSA